LKREKWNGDGKAESSWEIWKELSAKYYGSYRTLKSYTETSFSYCKIFKC
jgi:hypothetical protein